jgi:hypothetical protein
MTLRCNQRAKGCSVVVGRAASRFSRSLRVQRRRAQRAIFPQADARVPLQGRLEAG